MSCSGTTNYADAADLMWTAVSNAEYVQAFTCTYANATQGLVVMGTLVWFAIVAMSFVRTGSFAMPVVYTFLFGGAVLAQVAAPVLGFASVLLLGAFGLLAVLIARRMEFA